ncbi:hypothetical protein AEAC466_18480 [Asticcacaulis sp. AC466]|uniref:hydrolase n=1 Tax=Asticcacaulis sp. AC466 TaxID=1282362 RepID=UPI0003C3E299|nr:hydrolase [Asticcacaulis sp. AC466]ESQ82125.1 hypothetical protein AEAC466_18480 [Asticcacaulis sp. AC466]
MQLNANTTALVLIDLQKGIIGGDRRPYSGEQVVTVAKGLADRFRQAGATVVLVHVGFAADWADALRQPVDSPAPRPDGGAPKDYSDFADGLYADGDIIIHKRNWGAFYGTPLDLHLRRRGIDTVVLAGIATNYGVESTARDAWERGYELVIVEDACTTVSEDAQTLSFKYVFPRIARVTTSANLKLG